MALRTKSPPNVPAGSAVMDAELRLMGATGLGEFLRFVRQRAVGGRARDECEVADMWRACAERFKQMQSAQANAAQNPQVRPIPSAMQAHIGRLTALQSFRNTFSSVPVAFGMVPLHQLVCAQFEITVSKLEALKKHIPKKLTAIKLAQLCLPLAPNHAQCVVGREAGSEYVFHSDSHDLRSLGAQLVPASAIAGYHPKGHAQAAIVVGVGFSTNVLNVVRYENRLVLNNGYHRALALLMNGYAHAPCVIQVCSHWDDVGLCAMDEMSQEGPLYFTQARPPMLRDYLDPALTSQWALQPARRQITIKINHESRDVAEVLRG
jgi:hypothetical protein